MVVEPPGYAVGVAGHQGEQLNRVPRKLDSKVVVLESHLAESVSRGQEDLGMQLQVKRHIVGEFFITGAAISLQMLVAPRVAVFKAQMRLVVPEPAEKIEEAGAR